MEEKGEGFTGAFIKDTWTITMGVGNRGRRWGVVSGKAEKCI